MKILVDELPYSGLYCILFRHGDCLISGQDCPLMEIKKEPCPYLKVAESEATK